MRSLAIALLVLALPHAYSSPLQESKQQQKLRSGNRANGVPPRRVVVQDALFGFYVDQFQKQAEVSPEVFGKIVPFLRQFVQERFEISQRRTRALNQLRQTVANGGSEDELKRLIRELDTADAEFQSNQEKFLSQV